MTEMKSIINNLATIAKRELPKCKGCGGKGKRPYMNYAGKLANCYAKISDLPPVGPDYEPCPTCAELRKVTKKYDREMEYPEWARDFDLTIPALCDMLRTVGVYNKFISQLWWKLYDITPQDTNSISTKTFRAVCKYTDILTSDKFYGAVAEFLEREVEG